MLSLNTAKIKTTPTLLLGHRDDSQMNQYIHLESKCRHIRHHVASFNNCMGQKSQQVVIFQVLAHVIGALRWQPALALGEVHHCDVRGGHNQCQIATCPKQNTATKTSLCLGMLYFQCCGIYIVSACKKLRVFTFEFNETGNIKHLQLLFTRWSDDVVSIDDDHWENCDVSDKDRLAHAKLTHDKGCEMGIVEFVVKFRVNDKPSVNARQQVVKRTPVVLHWQYGGLVSASDCSSVLVRHPPWKFVYNNRHWIYLRISS